MTLNRSLAWKRRLGALSARVWDQGQPIDRRVILIYHSVDGGPWSTPISAFDEQLNWLRDNAVVVSLPSLLSGTDAVGIDPFRPRVALTFDDGYRSLHEVVAPRLDQCSFTATVYLNTGYLSESIRKDSKVCRSLYPDEEFLIWKEVKTLSERNWTVGSHGVHHVDLTVVSADEINLQLRDSKVAIESNVGRTCEHLAYPWGRHNAMVRDAAAKAGYRSAVAGRHGPVKESSDPFALPRLDVRKEYCLRDFADLVTGKWDFLGIKQGVMGLVRSK